MKNYFNIYHRRLTQHLAPNTQNLKKMEDLERILDLENEVIARFMESVLLDKDIPHILRTYHDSAYDGLFAYQQGWGFIEAPPKYRDEILKIYEEIKSQQ